MKIIKGRTQRVRAQSEKNNFYNHYFLDWSVHWHHNCFIFKCLLATQGSNIHESKITKQEFLNAKSGKLDKKCFIDNYVNNGGKRHNK